MNWELLLPAITTAISIGLSCGTTCSPIVNSFLTTYVISHSDGTKNGIKCFFLFFLGKILSVVALCVLSSSISMQFINQDGYIGNINLRLIMQILMSIIGIYLLFNWFKENKCSDCEKCNKKIDKNIPIFLIGIIYGLTPCAPLILIIGYTFTLPMFYAGITGFIFGIATILSPVLLLILITSVLSKKMKQEIPNFLKWFRLVSYLLLILLPAFYI